ncbi:hypothetical protein [Lacrimispora sp.]|nr:hypothetical protein [Lacrimispora sp.]
MIISTQSPVAREVLIERPSVWLVLMFTRSTATQGSCESQH